MLSSCSLHWVQGVVAEVARVGLVSEDGGPVVGGEFAEEEMVGLELHGFSRFF